MVASIFASQQPAFFGFAPVNIFPPVVSGSALVGGQLSCDPGTWSSEPDDPQFTYQWKRNGTNIVGATSSTYVTEADDLGQNISCTVTATNSDGSSQANSNTIQVGGAPINQSDPILTGDALIGATLTTTNGTWVGYPDPTFTYTWLRQGLPISSAPDQNTYVVQPADEGSAIQCRVTATNFFGDDDATSNAIGPMEPPLSAPVNTAVPICSNNPIVGENMDCGNGLWTANPDPTYTYQWQIDQTDVAGATENNYTILAEDLGKMIRVKVTATNSEGSADAYSVEQGPIVNPA